MHTLLKVIGLAFAALLVLPAAHAFPYAASFSGPDAVSLLEDTSVSIPLVIQNNDFHSHVVKLSGFSDDASVKILPNIKTFTIAPYESATIGVTIRASDDAGHGTILAKAKIDMDGQLLEVPLTVYVGSNPYLTLTTFSSTVCAQEYLENISVLVENKTSNDTDVTLRAEQSILLPFTDDESVTLESGIEQFVTFNVNVSPQNAGKYTGTITADTNRIIVVRPFVVNVNECPDVVEKTISLKLPTKIYDLPKLKTTNVPITVKNLTDDAQYVEFFADTTIPYSLNAVTIAPRDTAVVNIAFTPDSSISAGKKSVNITAVAGGYGLTQSLSVNVLPLDYLELLSVSNVYEITEGQSEILDFVAYNKGDSPQTITFGVQNGADGITYTFSPANITLASGKSAKIQATIRAAENVSVSSVNTFIVATGKTTATLPLAFSILNRDNSADVVMKFVSVPKEITLNQDEQKEITVTLRNETNTPVSAIRFKLVGVSGANISVISPASLTLNAYETNTFTLKIVTQEDTPSGVYSPLLIAQGDTGTGTAPISIRVNGGFSGLLTGLVTFANERAAVLGMIVLVILAVFYIVSRSERKTPAWTAK